MTNPLVEALEAATAALDRVAVQWAVTGSFALAYHGVSRGTQDVDIQVSLPPAPDLRPAIEKEMRAAGFRFHDELTYERRGFVVELYPVEARIEREAFDRRLRVRLLATSSAEYWIVTAEDLVLLKLREYLSTHDYKHVDDLQKLALVRRADLDWDYLGVRLDRNAGFRAAWENEVEERPDPKQKA